MEKVSSDYFTRLKARKTKEFLSFHFSPTYENGVMELIDALSDNNSFEEKKKAFDQFNQKFMPYRCIISDWEKIVKKEMKKNGTLTKESEWLLHLEVVEIYYKEFPIIYCREHLKTKKNALDCQTNCFGPIILKTLMENTFLFELDMYIHTFIKNDSPLWYEVNIMKLSSFKKLNEIEKYALIYEKLLKMKVELKCSLKERVDAMKDIETPEYIVKTIEQRFDGFDIEQWKIYFEYTRKLCCRPDKLLDVYRRYCRFFVDDLKMREEYREEIKKAKEKNNFDATKWVLDSIKLENDFGSKTKSAEMLQEFAKTRKINEPTFNFSMEDKFEENFEFLQKLLIKQSDENKIVKEKQKFQKVNFISQTFTYPTPLIEYICLNGNYELTQKFQYSSKQMYLFSKKQTLCLKLSISGLDKTEVHDEAIFISAKNPKIDGIKNFFVFNTLFVSYKDEPETLSKFIPKLFKCHARFLIPFSQILSLNEYNFLTNSKNIKLIEFHKTKIMENEKRTNLEDLMINLPNAEQIIFIPSPFINYETFDILKNFERNVKIKILRIESITYKFEPLHLCNFLQKHVGPNSEIKLWHEKVEDYQYLKSSVDHLLATWEPLSEQPDLKLFNYDF